MLRIMEKIMLHNHDHFMWHLYLNGVGLWIRIHSLLPHMVCYTLYEGFRNKLWSMSEDLCHVCKLLPCSIVWGLWRIILCFQKGLNRFLYTWLLLCIHTFLSAIFNLTVCAIFYEYYINIICIYLLLKFEW